MMIIGRREWRFWGRWCEMVGFLWAVGVGKWEGWSGGVWYVFWSLEVMDLVRRLLMGWMEQLLGDGTW